MTQHQRPEEHTRKAVGELAQGPIGLTGTLEAGAWPNVPRDSSAEEHLDPPGNGSSGRARRKLHVRKWTLIVWTLRVGVLSTALLLWQLAPRVGLDTFYTSSPRAVANRISEWFSDGTLFYHFVITIQEAVLGYGIGALAGIVIGIALGLSQLLGAVADPFVQAANSMPKLALAPVFILYFGIDLTMKVIFTAVIVFFLVFWNTYGGVRNVDKGLIDVARIMSAGRWDVVTKIVLPSSTSSILLGMKIALPYGIVGAVVGEIIASNRGLGYLLANSAARFDIAGMFAVVLVLVAVTSSVNFLLIMWDKRIRRWQG